MNVGAGESKVFSIHKYCHQNNISGSESLVQDPTEYEKAEKVLLQEYFSHVSLQGAHGRWLNWNMNSDTYGFAHLEERYKQLFSSDGYHVPDENRLDVDRVLEDIYGHRYMCDPKLMNIIKLNGLPKQAILSGDREAFAFMAGQWKQIHDSAHDKVGIINQIAHLAHQGKLVTHTPNWRAHLVGWVKAKSTDHPIQFWLTAGAGIIGFIASIIQIVTTFPHK